MRADSRLHNAIGLAMKAGKCVSGDFVVERTLRDNKARLVLLDETVSNSTRERYERLCQRDGTPLVMLRGLGQAIGKPSRMIAAVTDENMTKLILGASAPCDKNGGKA